MGGERRDKVEREISGGLRLTDVVERKVRALNFILRSDASGFIRHVRSSTDRVTFPK